MTSFVSQTDRMVKHERRFSHEMKRKSASGLFPIFIAGAKRYEQALAMNGVNLPISNGSNITFPVPRHHAIDLQD